MSAPKVIDQPLEEESQIIARINTANYYREEVLRSYLTPLTSRVERAIEAMGGRLVKDEEWAFHIPANWTDVDIETLQSLYEIGVPLMIVPKAVMSKLTKDYDRAKGMLLKHDDQIIKACEELLENIEGSDYHDHFYEALECFKAGHFRASQSTSTILIDSKMEDLFDYKKYPAWRNGDMHLAASRFKNLATKHGLFSNINQLPLNPSVPFYALLCARALFQAFAIDFKIAKPDEWSTVDYYDRNISAHTVSSSQYNGANALTALMLVSELFLVEAKYKKYWVQEMLLEYNIVSGLDARHKVGTK